MHYKLRQAPFIRLFLPLIGGILIQHKVALTGWIIYFLPAAFLLIVILIKLSGFASHFVWTRTFGLAVNICLFFFGMGLVKDIEVRAIEPGIRIGTISKIPESTGNSYRLILDRIHERSGNNWKKMNGKALLYLNSPVDSSLLRPGNKILFYGRLDTISKPKNPLAFDARRYYGNRKIIWKLSLSEANSRIIQSNDLRLTIKAELFRLHLIGILNAQGIKNAEIITALLTGYRQGLAEGEKRFFVESGAMHIMAVSGLHTGLIYGMISLLFSLFFRKQRILNLLLPIPFIWIFAMITGLSPSVCRAALMITLFASSACLNRHKNYYNVLFFSAFILVIINPGIIFEISFQLSFTAVFGIVSCFIPAYNKLRTGRYIPDRIIGLLLLSLFAQVFTFPLSAFYFHQFPHYFLLTNLLVVPLVPLILYAGILMLAFQLLPAIATAAGNILNLLSGVLLSIVQWVSNLPHSVSYDIFFRPVEVVIFYAMILSFMVWLKHRLSGFLFPGLAIVILLLGFDIYDDLTQNNQEMIHVYHNRGALICDFVVGRKHVILHNDSNSDNLNLVSHRLQNYWLKLGLKDHQYINSKSISEYRSDNICIRRNSQVDGLIIVNFRSYNMGLLSSCPVNFQTTGAPLELDCLVLYADGRFKLDSVLGFINPGTIIIDSNVSYYQSKNWERICQKRNIPYHSIYKKGYFMKEL